MNILLMAYNKVVSAIQKTVVRNVH